MPEEPGSAAFAGWVAGAIPDDEAFRRGRVVSEYRRRGYTLETIEFELTRWNSGPTPSRAALGRLAKTWDEIVDLGVTPTPDIFGSALRVMNKTPSQVRRSLLLRVSVLPVIAREEALRAGLADLLRRPRHAG